MDSDGNADGELFYDDGESIDTISSKNYFHATFQWSSNNGQLTMSIVQNTYAHMSNLILDSLTFYELDSIPAIIHVNGKQFHPTQRPNTNIVEVTGLELSMSENHIFTSKGMAVMIHYYLFLGCFITWIIQGHLCDH